jgi:hypothetical protein
VESLRPGDMVLTLDQGAQPVVAVDIRHVDAHMLRHDPRRRPIVIAAGAMGHGLPVRPLALSRQHRVLLSGGPVRRETGQGAVLAAVAHLTDLPGVAVRGGTDPVTYVHLALPGHAILLAEGLPAESLWAGDFDSGPAAVPARPFVDAGAARAVAHRIARAAKAALDPADARAARAIAAAGRDALAA